MVTTALIDTTFLFEKTHKTFVGAKLLKHNGKDVTYAFGFLRDVLRLRQNLELRRGLFLVGENAYRIAPAKAIEHIAQLMDELGFPVTHHPNERVLALASEVADRATHVVTHDRSLLQLATKSLRILLPTGNGDYSSVSGDKVKSYVGVESQNVATFLSLTTRGAAHLTNRQAIRLIELHGDLDTIYSDLGQIASVQIRDKLSANENRIRSIYADLDVGTQSRRRVVPRNDGPALNLQLNNQKTRRILSDYGFHSLIRLLELKPSASSVAIVSPGSREPAPRGDYAAVVDRSGLRLLESTVQTAQYCAIDAESDDKDPRRATLFGVSFAVRAGGAYFVPFLDKDLKGISRDDVAQSLRRIFGSGAKFIGHNIKYDYLLLLRNGLRIKTVHFDTMLATYECYGDWDFFNLPYVVEKLLNRKIKPYREVVEKGRTFLDLPFTELVGHGCEDADVTLQLHDCLQRQLESKVIERQFFCETMSRMKRLGEIEHQGLRVSTGQLEKIRLSLVAKAKELKELAFHEIGTTLDFDSPKALELIVRDALNLRDAIGTKKISPSLLEQLAISNPRLEHLVKYKRAAKRLGAVESIIKCVDGRTVHPVFNQIRSTYGALTSKNPNLFGVNGVPELRDAFGKEIRSYFRDEAKSLNLLQELAMDEALQADRAHGRGNAYLATHAVTSDLQPQEHDELVLLLALDQSAFDFSKRFLVDRLAAGAIRHDMQVRYRRTFQFLEEFCRKSLADGYAFSRGQRKYLAGLKSSNLNKRANAQKYAVRWLLGY